MGNNYWLHVYYETGIFLDKRIKIWCLYLSISCPYIVKYNFSQYFETGEIGINTRKYMGSILTW